MTVAPRPVLPLQKSNHVKTEDHENSWLDSGRKGNFADLSCSFVAEISWRISPRWRFEVQETDVDVMGEVMRMARNHDGSEGPMTAYYLSWIASCSQYQFPAAARNTWAPGSLSRVALPGQRLVDHCK